jgi:metacaspase-1
MSTASGIGRVVIASSRSSEYSIVFNGQRNSVFTTHALDGLRGKAFSRNDGLIRVFDLFNYISEQVRRSVPGDQHPIFKATALEDNFPLALYKGGTKSVGSLGGNVSESTNDDWQELQKLMPELYPGGPEDQSIWERAGGDRSKLTLNGTGQAKWFSALRTLRLGGGGAISRTSLLHAVCEEFPHHPGVTAAMSK